MRRAWDNPRRTPGGEASQEPSRSTNAVAVAPAASLTVGTGDSVATVNGVDVPRSEFERLLVGAYGLDLLDLRIRLALAKQAVAAAGLSVTDADVHAEYERVLVSLAVPGGEADAAKVDLGAAEDLLSQVLARNHVAREQFMLKVDMDAHLRKIAQSQVSVTDEMLPAEYDRCYGERVQVRHIQLNSLAEAAEARDRLAAGESFAEVARECSRNAVTGMNGGLLPPFSRYDDVPPLLRDAAFALKVGEVSSSIAADGVFHILRLEQRFPASTVKLEYVKDELRRRLRERLVAKRMEELAAELFDAATIRIRDPSLAEQFRRRYPGRASR